MSFTYNPFTVRGDLKKLAEAGALTPEHLQACWEQHLAERRNIGVDRIPREDVPMGLSDLFNHTTIGFVVEGAVRGFNVRFRLRLPPVIAWIKENPEAFAAMAMDHGTFLKMALEHPVLGERIFYEVAESPQLIASLDKNEALAILEQALKTHGHLVSWSGMGYADQYWPVDRLQEMILRLVEEPEVAGGFLANEWAHAGGWRLFKTVEDFLAVVKKAASRAPFEAHQNRTWIATRLGELASGDDFMATDSGWANYPEHYTKKYEPLGLELYKQVAAEIDAAYQWGVENAEEPLSICSRVIIDKIKARPAQLTDSREATEMAATLVHLPEGKVASELLQRLFALMETNGAARVYRFALGVQTVFWRDMYRIMGQDMGGHWEHRMAETMVRESWFFAEMKKSMKAKGWRGLVIEKRRNERFREDSDRGWDRQVSCELEDGRLHIFKLWRGLTSREDSYMPDKIVLVPPNLLQIGGIVYESERTVIHETGETFHVDEPATDKMGGW